MSPSWALCRDIRRRAELSQRELAQRAGVSPSTVARIEKGRIEPTLDLLLRLAHAAGLELRIRLTPDDGTARPTSTLDFEQRLEEAAQLSKVAFEMRRSRKP